MDRKTRREKERLKKGAIMKSRMNKLMSLCLVAMMGTTLIPQPIQAEEVSEFEEESFEETTVEFEEATFEEESNQVAESSVESNRKTPVLDTFDDGKLRYQVTGVDTVEVIGFADGYQPTGYELRIPETVSKQGESDKEYAVTSIGDNAFKDCQYLSIKEIELPISLKSIGESAFAGFTSIMGISGFSFDQITTIGKSAFAGCTSLRYWGNAMDYLELPGNLTTIGESVFEGCTSIKSVRVEYDFFEGPSTIRLETIGKSAFAGCTSLWGLDLPDSLKTIGKSAFAGCTSLWDLDLPAGLTTIEDEAFANCLNITGIKLSNSLTTVGSSAFQGCTSLDTLGFAEGITKIEKNRIKDFSSIKYVECPNSLTTIEESAFEGFTSLKHIDLPDSLTTIGKSAFAGCTSLEDITLPVSLKTINESTFSGCTSLDRIELPEGLTTIGKSAFSGCTSLDDRDLNLPAGLTTIGDSAFSGCTSLDSIELPEGLTTIGDSAFALGESTAEETSPHLSFINIPSSVKTLGSIFGDKNPFGKRYEYSYEPLLFFQGDSYPEIKEGFLRVISEGKNKPTIYFPNTETAIDAYAGKNSPFVKVGLIDATHFDPDNEQKYETIQVCPGATTTLPIEGYFGKLKVTSDNPDVAFVTQGEITGKSIGKAIITYTYEINGIEVASDKFEQFKVTVDHKYVWMCEDLPSKDQPGSMFQYCLLCHDQKPSISFPDYPMNPDLPEEAPSIIIGTVQDGNFESVATVETDDQPFELVVLPLKDGSINLQNYSCKVESSDPNIATVNINEKGNILVTPVNEGIAIITATYTKEKESLASSKENSFVNESGSDNELKATFVVEVVDSKDDIPTGGGSSGGSTGGGSGGGSTGGSGGSSTGGGSTGGSTSGGSSTDSNAPTQQVENAVYRVYNPYNGEHLYTTNYEEFKVITKNGWDDEGIAFMSESKEKGQAVYRVYNPNSGLHHYTCLLYTSPSPRD